MFSISKKWINDMKRNPDAYVCPDINIAPIESNRPTNKTRISQLLQNPKRGGKTTVYIYRNQPNLNSVSPITNF